MQNDQLERVSRGPILCDGATKTQLVELAFGRDLISDREVSFSTGLWNVEQPEPTNPEKVLYRIELIP